MDDLPELMNFADCLEQACIDTIESGIMTGDLAAIWEGEVEPQKVTSREFLLAVSETLADLLEDEDEVFYTLTDSEGNESEYEQIWAVDLGEKHYVVMVPADDDGEELLILQKIIEGGEELFMPSDEKDAETVYEMFQESLDDSRGEE